MTLSGWIRTRVYLARSKLWAQRLRPYTFAFQPQRHVVSNHMTFKLGFYTLPRVRPGYLNIHVMATPGQVYLYLFSYVLRNIGHRMSGADILVGDNAGQSVHQC